MTTFTSTHPKYGTYNVVQDQKGGQCTVHFPKTGYTYRAKFCNVSRGQVRDPFAPIIHGVGCVGVGGHTTTINGKNNPAYVAWDKMLERCYSETRKNKHYKDCTVCERWHCFQTFAEDIKSLPGYNDWKAAHDAGIKRKYSLDKDSRIQGNREYSPEACCFLLHSDNVKEAINRTRPVEKWAVGTIHPTKYGNVEVVVAASKGKCTVLFLDHNITKETWTSSLRKDQVSPF